MATTPTVIPSDLQSEEADPPGQEQQPQITAITNGGVTIVPNSINDGPLVHMGTYPLWSPSWPKLTPPSTQDVRRHPYRGQTSAH